MISSCFVEVLSEHPSCRPYVHKILVVIEPLLIDEDYYARVEGREIISNLAKAAGLATMIATCAPKPLIDGCLHAVECALLLG